MGGIGTFLGSYWYAIASAVGMTVLLLLCGISYFRAMEPKAGTLEWITLYDRRGRSLAGRWTGLDRRDAVPLLTASVVAAAAWSFAAWRTLRTGYTALSALEQTEMVMHYGLVPVVTACFMYLLGKGLTGSTLTALLGTLVLSLDLTAEPLLVLLTAGQALALTRFLTAEEEQSFGGACLPLILAFALNAVSCYVYAGFLVVTAAMVLLLIVCAAVRFVHLGHGWLLRSLWTAVLTWAAVTVLVYVPGAAAAGIAFPSGFLNEKFYLFLALRFFSGVQAAFWGMPFNPAPLYFDWPMLLCGLSACVALLVGMIRWRDLTALVGILWFAGLTAAWLLTGLYTLPVGCILCIGGIWGGFCRRGKPFPVLLGSACLLALLLGLFILSWFLQ